MTGLIRRLAEGGTLSREEYEALIAGRCPETEAVLFPLARQRARELFGGRIYIRGLIECSNFCRNDCYYCGIRRSNGALPRYRLTAEQVMACCREGYAAGFRTFVLQGGEDPVFTGKDSSHIARLVEAIKGEFPDCAVTLSLGEWDPAVYRMWREAGADRYLLRHETANFDHYRRLHPPELSPERRRDCLRSLKDLGYQVGAGFLVGSPRQTPRHLAEDFAFLLELSPQMVGIGPFLPHHDTPFRQEPPGSVEETLFCLALLRLSLPGVLLPATTALGTAAEDGRERGILAGANVVMPNLSPPDKREQYSLYDNKRCTGEEAAEGLAALRARLERIGYEPVTDRGDFKAPERKEGF